MKQITGEEFKKETLRNPSWCATLISPIEITTFVSLIGANITHLSPFLHFKGDTSRPSVADFIGCGDLKEACGNFYGYVSFLRSSVTSTKNIKVLGTDKNGWSASFYDCSNLEVLEGEFEGAVDLEMSSVKKIEATVKNRSTKAIHKFEKNRKFFINGCDKLIPNKKYLSSDYQIDDSLKKEIKRQVEIRNSLSRIHTA